MQLYIHQRVTLRRDIFDVYDEDLQTKYFVKEDRFTAGHELHVYDMQDNVVGFIDEQVLTARKTFILELFGEPLGFLRQKMPLLPRYETSFNNWLIKCDPFGWYYDIYDGTTDVAHIMKTSNALGDVYKIDICNPADEWVVLLIAIALDVARDRH